MIIAIDGPAGSGKSTIAREVANRLGLRYLDTGAMYRTVTLLAMEAGMVPRRIPEAGNLAANAIMRLEERPDDLTRVFVGDREVSDDIRGRLVSQNVSAVSADPGVRAVLTQKQRDEAARGNVLLEGRDMGTVVVPDADLKVFLTASIEERARRRSLQLLAQGVTQPLEELITDINARDAYDSGRELAPLRKAGDAVEIDTTGLTIEQVVGAVCALAIERGAATSSEAANAAAAPPATGVTPSVAPPSTVQAVKWPISRMVRSPLDTFLYRVAYSFLPPLWRLLFRMEIAGRDHFPAAGAVVLASNHRSNLDPFFLGVSCPRQIHFMAKAELWKVKALGRVLDMLGAFPISRGEADREAVKRAVNVLGTGAVLGIFPEGRRQRAGQLGDIHPGVSLFSLREGTVTIPAVIEGSERIAKGRIIRFPRVRVAFGPPLELPEKDMPRSHRAAITAGRLVSAYREILADSAEKR